MSKPNLLQIIKSVIAAAVGIQSNANRTKDFSSGSPGIYLAIGLIATLTFILCIVLVVAAVV
jgi:hypothetical protein